MKTCSTADIGYNFCIIGNSRSEINHGDEYQNRKECDDVIQHQIRIKMHQKITNRVTISLYPRGFTLHINNNNDDRQ